MTTSSPQSQHGGVLGPALTAALRDYQAALARLERAEAAVDEARREAGESRARLRALSTGARLTGVRALVAVDENCPEDR